MSGKGLEEEIVRALEKEIPKRKGQQQPPARKIEEPLTWVPGPGKVRQFSYQMCYYYYYYYYYYY